MTNTTNTTNAEVFSAVGKPAPAPIYLPTTVARQWATVKVTDTLRELIFPAGGEVGPETRLCRRDFVNNLPKHIERRSIALRLGVRTKPIDLMVGLCEGALLHAHGESLPLGPHDRLSPLVKVAVEKITDLTPKGKGVTAGVLFDAVSLGVKAMLALPLKPGKAPDLLAAPEPEQEPTEQEPGQEPEKAPEQSQEQEQIIRIKNEAKSLGLVVMTKAELKALLERQETWEKAQSIRRKPTQKPNQETGQPKPEAEAE